MAHSTLDTTVRPDALTAGEVAILRSMLEEQRTFRIEQLAQLTQTGPGIGVDSAVAEVLASLAAGARSALSDVEAALCRMDEGRFGRCTRCAGAIERERLEILPQLAQCLSCQRRC